MVKWVSAAEAKAHFSALVAEVAYGGAQIVIQRRGRPLAALVSLADFDQLAQSRAPSGEPRGALALVGAWSNVEDGEIDAMVADIYAQRARDASRPVELPE